MNKNQLSLFIRALISLAIILFLFYKIGFADIYSLILDINIFFIPLILALFVLNFIFAAIKINLLLKPLGRDVGFFNILNIYITSWSFGLFSPSKIGEFSMPFFLKKRGIGMGYGLALQVTDKIITILCFSLVASFGVIIFFAAKKSTIFLIILFLTIIFILTIIFSKYIRGLTKRYILKKHSKKFKGFSKTLFFYIKKAKKYIFLNFIFSIVKIITMGFVMYFLFLSFNVKVPLIFIILIMSITLASSLIPISVNGLGVRQTIGIFLYSQIGVPSLITMGNYTIQLALNYLTAASFIWYHLWKNNNYPKK